MPVIKMMAIIVLISLMAIAMEEMPEVSSTSFAMEEPTRMARMILNNKDNDKKSSTKFFMKENNKDEGGCHALMASTIGKGRKRTFSGRRTKKIVQSKSK